MESRQAAEVIRSATQGVFETMLGTELTSGEPFEDPEPFYASEVTALIGLAGEVAGYVSIHCTGKQAAAFTARLLGMEAEEVLSQDEVRDAVGELVNMIAGSVKTGLSSHGKVEIALPTVVMTPKPDMRVKDCCGLAVPFEDESGVFYVELVTTKTDASSFSG